MVFCFQRVVLTVVLFRLHHLDEPQHPRPKRGDVWSTGSFALTEWALPVTRDQALIALMLEIDNVSSSVDLKARSLFYQYWLSD